MDTNTYHATKNLHKISIAPMMDCTDKHFRMIMRKISSEALLYTEMIVAQSLIFNKTKEKFLDFNYEEHPISIQLGGDKPNLLKDAAKMAEDWGYDEVNFNVGCPSAKVKSGNFGASMMNTPEKVADCISAIKNNCKLPVTVKHRIGVDDNDSFDFLNGFVRKVSEAGAVRFTVHARKAILKGLNPKENRRIPPLRYDIVKRLKEENQNLCIEINGGFTNIEQCVEALKSFDGVMIGRSAYNHPLRWVNIDEEIYNKKPVIKKASEVILSLLPYFEEHLIDGGESWDICKHLINLVESKPMAKKWRNTVTLKSLNKELDTETLTSLVNELKVRGY